jgi:MarR family 2-MHQ and catechol resistance regulon transcriptional repressor
MGTKYKGSEDEVLSLNSYITMLRATDTITSILNNLLSKNDLTVSQFGVLEALYYLGPLCQKQLSTKILKSTANITTVIDNLEKRNLVKRVRDKNDRRFITVHLSDKGKITLEMILPLHIQEILKCMSSLNKSEKNDLYKICKKLGLSNLRS